MNSSEVISKPQLTSMIHFLEERDEESKKLDEQLKVKKKSHQTSAIRHQKTLALTVYEFKGSRVQGV